MTQRGEFDGIAFIVIRSALSELDHDDRKLVDAWIREALDGGLRGAQKRAAAHCRVSWRAVHRAVKRFKRVLRRLRDT